MSKLMSLLKASIFVLPFVVLSAVTSPAQQPGSQAIRNLTPVTDAMLRNPPAG